MAQRSGMRFTGTRPVRTKEHTTTEGKEGTHHKYHWMLNESAVKVVAVIEWEDTCRDLDFSLGKGERPHQGET